MKRFFDPLKESPAATSKPMLLIVGRIVKTDYLTTMNYPDHIFIDPNIRFGKPCVKGTRISVYDVLGWLAEGMTHEQIISDFPELNEQAIRACLAFAADREHKFRIAS